MLPLLLTVLAFQTAQAQSPPSFNRNIQIVQDALNRQGPVKWVQKPKKPTNPPEATPQAIDVTDTISEVRGDSSVCTLSFKMDHHFPEYQVATAWTIPFRDMEKIIVESAESSVERFRTLAKMPPWGGTTVPVIFVVQIYALPGHEFKSHVRSTNRGQEPVERDQPQSLASLSFKQEATAQEVAAALLRTHDTCPH